MDVRVHEQANSNKQPTEQSGEMKKGSLAMQSVLLVALIAEFCRQFLDASAMCWFIVGSSGKQLFARTVRTWLGSSAEA